MTRLKPQYKLKTGFLNLYKNPRAHKVANAMAGGLYKSRHDADQIAKPHRLVCIQVWWPELVRSNP